MRQTLAQWRGKRPELFKALTAMLLVMAPMISVVIIINVTANRHVPPPPPRLPLPTTQAK